MQIVFAGRTSGCQFLPWIPDLIWKQKRSKMHITFFFWSNENYPLKQHWQGVLRMNLAQNVLPHTNDLLRKWVKVV